MCLSDKLIKKLESFQGSLMKRSLGLSKFSHHSKLLEALNIPKVSDLINNMTISLWNYFLMSTLLHVTYVSVSFLNMF